MRRSDTDAERLVLEVPDARLSANHLRVVRLGRSFALTDRASKNGTGVGDRRVDHAPLHDGDLIQAGGTFLLFREAVAVSPGPPLELGAATGDEALTTCEPGFVLPSLRDRREDLGLIVVSLLARLAPGRTVSLTPAAGRALLQHPWPGNVRELEQALRRALALTSGVLARAMGKDRKQIHRWLDRFGIKRRG